MKYCEHTTCSHPICEQFKEQVQFIDTIFRTEGCNTKLFDKEKAINLDEVEIELCKNNRCTQATMDLAIGISREEKNSQMLLIELKFNVKNPANIKKGDLETKIKHSIEILSREIPIHDIKIIVFDNKQISVARSWIARMFGKPANPTILVKTAKELKDEYFNN